MEEIGTESVVYFRAPQGVKSRRTCVYRDLRPRTEGPATLALQDFRLETYFSRWEFAARYHLTASDAQSMTLSELLAMADPADREAFDRLGSAIPKPMARRRCARRSPVPVTGASQPTSSASPARREGIYIASHVLLEAGDHAIVVTPNYQAAETVPLSICAVTGVPLDPEDN